MKKIFAVVLKEFRQVRRDPLSLGMMLGLPALMLLLYGFALNFDVKHISLAVQDRDLSSASRELKSAFINSTYFDHVGTLESGDKPHDWFVRRRARAVLVIPENYSSQLESGSIAEVQWLVDGSDANTASTVLGYAQSIVNRMNARFLEESELSHGRTVLAPIRYEPRVWYNPELKSTQFLVPGLIGFIMMLTAVLSTAMSVVREKERGTMEQLRMTSLRPGQLIIGKTIPYLAISLAAAGIILIAARFLFHVSVRGSYIDLTAAVLLYLLGALGLGLLVSSISRSQAMAFQLGSLLSMLPSIFLSGFIFPIRNMPTPLQAVTHLFPPRYFLVILRGIILKNASILDYPKDLAFLVVYGALVLGFAYVRLTKDEA